MPCIGERLGSSGELHIDEDLPGTIGAGDAFGNAWSEHPLPNPQVAGPSTDEVQGNVGIRDLAQELRLRLDSMERKLDLLVAKAGDASPSSRRPSLGQVANPRRTTLVSVSEMPRRFSGGSSQSDRTGPGGWMMITGSRHGTPTSRPCGGSLNSSKSIQEEFSSGSVVPSQPTTSRRRTSRFRGWVSKAQTTDIHKQNRFLMWMGVPSTFSRIYKAVEEIEDTRHWKVLHSTGVQLAVSFVILLHACLTGYDVNNSLDVEATGAAHATWVDDLELVFTAFFVLELVVRAIIERIAFIFGSEWKWNLFDSTLIMMSIVDIVTTSGADENSASGGISFGRLLRLSRFTRLMRISRVMRHLQSLRTILYAILASMSSLFWCLIFIMFNMYVFAVFIVSGVADWFSRDGQAQDPELGERLMKWWGSIYRSMVSLFMAITGGADWSDLMEPLREMEVFYESLFLAYIFFMLFGVLNVVVGAFVATTAQIIEGDREVIVRSQMERMAKYKERILGFFREADVDKSGTLTWDEFKDHLQDPAVMAYFQALDLDVTQAHVLFDLLDNDGSDQVTLDEFLDGCVRLRGHARSVEMNKLLFMCDRVFNRLTAYMRASEKNIEAITKKLDIEYAESSELW